MSANDAAASSSNVAAEGTHVDSQSDIMAAIIEGKIDPFCKTAREFVSPSKNTTLHIKIMCRNRSSMETRSTKFVEDILDGCSSLLRQVNDNDETPLHVAAKYGHSDIVDVLIKSSAKAQNEDPESGTTKEMLKMTNNEGNTALHEAVKYNHLDVVKILTKDHDFTYASNNRGETPLYIAAAAAVAATAAAAAAAAPAPLAIIDFAKANMKNSLEIVVEILETCKNPAFEGPDQMTALHAVAMIKYIPGITRKILEKTKSLIKEKDQYGWTPLHHAAYHRNSESMEALLECDVSTAYIGDKDRKMTPLHIAIGRGYIPDEIISRCPDCCVLVDERRWNVLHFAMLSLSHEDLKVLLKKYPLIKNLINDKDVDGNTPLHFLTTFRPSLLLWIIKHEDIFLDLGVINNQNMSVLGVRKFGSDQLKQEILKLEEPAGPYRDGVVRVKENLWGPLDVEKIKEVEKTKESQLIVAALIATVTFTAAFTLPGGVIQDEGTAILSKKAAFQAFVITDAIAMILSLSAVFAYFLMSNLNPKVKRGTFQFLLTYGVLSTEIAMVAMVIAFVTGTYAVLTTSLWLAILTTFIGLSFFLLMFLIPYGMVRVLMRFGFN